MKTERENGTMVYTCSRSGRPPAPHGREWQQVMAQLGYLNPSRLHTVATEEVRMRRRARKVRGSCGCQTHWLTRRKARVAGYGRVVCRACKCPVTVSERGISA